MPNVQEIVEAYLWEHSFDGLYNERERCCCPLDDLMPCCEANRCLPGVRHTDPSGECPFIIGPKKPEEHDDA